MPMDFFSAGLVCFLPVGFALCGSVCLYAPFHSLFFPLGTQSVCTKWNAFSPCFCFQTTRWTAEREWVEHGFFLSLSHPFELFFNIGGLALVKYTYSHNWSREQFSKCFACIWIVLWKSKETHKRGEEASLRFRKECWQNKNRTDFGFGESRTKIYNIEMIFPLKCHKRIARNIHTRRQHQRQNRCERKKTHIERERERK